MAPDILILGGGPAGLSTALHLARRAPELRSRILVLEKAHYPRPKLCGGALLADAEVILERLGLDVREIPHIDAAQAHLDFEGKGLTYTVRGKHALRMIRRDEFDAWLAAKTRLSGIEIREGITVASVVAGEDSVLVRTNRGDFEAVIVVGADGSNGVTRRCVLPDSRARTARLLEVVTSDFPRGSDDRQATAYFDFFPVPDAIAGYTWDFPTQVSGTSMRCWGIYDTNLLVSHARPPMRKLLAAEMSRHGYSLDDGELQGFPIRFFSPFDRFSVPRVLLVGDAAGADGLFGEGISIALGYGRLAAAAIRHALASNNYSFRDYHRRLLLSPLGRALTMRAAIMHILYRLRWPWFQKFFWRRFRPVVVAASSVLVLNWARRMK
jgi:flavin-dependent dehydrogenase